MSVRPPGTVNDSPSSTPLGVATLGGRPHFRLLGIPVRIDPGFWLMAVILGGVQDWRKVGIWVFVVLVSVLLHEFGHAVVARIFGAAPAILLHTLGGLTFYSGKLSRVRSALVSLAGPLAGISAGLLLHAATLFHGDFAAAHPLATEAVSAFLFVNIGWGIVNLLPVLPFDGGQILAAVLGPRRLLLTGSISAVVGVAVSAFAVREGHVYLAVLFGTAAISAIRLIREGWAQALDAREGLESTLAEARAALDAGRNSQALQLAREVVDRARTRPSRDAAWKLIAWAHVAQGEGQRAREALAQLGPLAAVDVYTLAAVEDAAGNRVGAMQVLEVARERGSRTVQMSKLLIDVHARGGDLERVAQVAAQDLDLLAPEEARAVLRTVLDGNEPRGAADLAHQLFERYQEPLDGIEEARAWLRSGELDRALAALSRAVPVLRSQGRGLGSLLQDPEFEPLASDERFTRIVTA